MPVNYSKWDALELSDDSDIEVHPNVDKRSFIRAKQAQIHQEREHRKLRIETLKYERIVNDGLLQRIDGLISALEAHANDYRGKQADELVLGTMVESTMKIKGNTPPPRPKGVHSSEKTPQPEYSQMMAHLVDQVKSDLDKKGEAAQGDARYGQWMIGLRSHQQKVRDLNVALEKDLGALEAAEKSKITSADIHDGFNTSQVRKAEPIPKVPSDQAGKKLQAVEQINPNVGPKDTPDRDGAVADVEDNDMTIKSQAEAEDEDDDHMEASPLGLKFSKIPMSDLRASMQFVFENPGIVRDREHDGLLAEAFNRALDKQYDRCHQCVHQALLIQYCSKLGNDGARLFFKRITTPGHQSKKLFYDDVNDTFNKIKTRSKEILKERETNPSLETGGVEQIQLQAVDPGTSIQINVPAPITEGTTATVEQMQARAIFETFPPNFQRALETGDLTRINAVLGRMSVDEAEDIVNKLGDAGMLSLEEGVLDTTTEEGKKHWEEIQEQARDEKRGSSDRIEEVEEQARPGQNEAGPGESSARPSGVREDGTLGTEDPA